MADLNEFVSLIESRMRCVFVTEQPVDLGRLDVQNSIYVLQLPEGFATAFGSRGGFGARKVLRVYQYFCGQGDCKKVNEFGDQEKVDSLDLPYQAAAFPILLPDGREKLVSGVADRELVAAYRKALG